MIEEIDAAFNVRGKPVIFAWGDVIYAPNRKGELPKSLLVHEAVHGERQKAHEGGIEGWWRRYIAEPRFRLDEEIPAHRAELVHLMTKAKGPSMRAHYLSRVASRIASPLYGNLITIAEAKKLLAA